MSGDARPDAGQDARLGRRRRQASNGATGSDSGQQQSGEQILATKTLRMRSKRFYLDAKQSRRGKYIRVAEIGADGRRSEIFLALSTAADFRDRLGTFIEFCSGPAGPPNPDAAAVAENGKPKSETMFKDDRRYYLDLKENARGTFLRVSQKIIRGGRRSQVAIPAQGMIEFRDGLADLLDEFGTDDGGGGGVVGGCLPDGRHVRAGNKGFHFDVVGRNNRGGAYVRISDVTTAAAKGNVRTAITVPEKSWSRFRDYFRDCCDRMAERNEKSSRTAATTVPAESTGPQ